MVVTSGKDRRKGGGKGGRGEGRKEGEWKWRKCTMGFNCFFNVLFLEKKEKDVWTVQDENVTFLLSGWMDTGINYYFQFSVYINYFWFQRAIQLPLHPLCITRVFVTMLTLLLKIHCISEIATTISSVFQIHNCLQILKSVSNFPPSIRETLRPQMVHYLIR